MLRPRSAVVAALALAACHSKPAPQPPGAGSGPALLAKKVVLSWGISQAGSSADVYLQTTDETGSQVSHTVGTFPGQCSEIKPAPEMSALIGAACVNGATGLELHVVAQDQQIVVLRMRTDQGVKADPMAREELMRFAVAPGAGIEAHP